MCTMLKSEGLRRQILHRLRSIDVCCVDPCSDIGGVLLDHERRTAKDATLEVVSLQDLVYEAGRSTHDSVPTTVRVLGIQTDPLRTFAPENVEAVVAFVAKKYPALRHLVLYQNWSSDGYGDGDPEALARFGPGKRCTLPEHLFAALRLRTLVMVFAEDLFGDQVPVHQYVRPTTALCLDDHLFMVLYDGECGVHSNLVAAETRFPRPVVGAGRLSSAIEAAIQSWPTRRLELAYTPSRTGDVSPVATWLEFPRCAAGASSSPPDRALAILVAILDAHRLDMADVFLDYVLPHRMAVVLDAVVVMEAGVGAGVGGISSSGTKLPNCRHLVLYPGGSLPPRSLAGHVQTLVLVDGAVPPPDMTAVVTVRLSADDTWEVDGAIIG